MSSPNTMSTEETKKSSNVGLKIGFGVFVFFCIVYFVFFRKESEEPLNDLLEGSYRALITQVGQPAKKVYIIINNQDQKVTAIEDGRAETVQFLMSTKKIDGQPSGIPAYSFKDLIFYVNNKTLVADSRGKKFNFPKVSNKQLTQDQLDKIQ